VIALALAAVAAAVFGDGSDDESRLLGGETGATSSAATSGSTQAAPPATTTATQTAPSATPPTETTRSRLAQQATCRTRAFRVVFDPEQGIVITDEGRILASASAVSREISPDCTPVPRRRLRFANDIPARVVYERGVVECRAPGRVRIDARPVWMGGVYGSIIVVSRAEGPVWFVSAVFVEDPAGRRVYYLRKYCAPI